MITDIVLKKILELVFSGAIDTAKSTFAGIELQSRIDSHVAMAIERMGKGVDLLDGADESELFIYVEDAFISDARDFVLATGEDEKSSKRSLINAKAIERSRAQTQSQKQHVKGFISALLDMVNSFYLDKLSDTERMHISVVVESLSEKIEHSSHETQAGMKKLEANLSKKIDELASTVLKESAKEEKEIIYVAMHTQWQIDTSLYENYRDCIGHLRSILGSASLKGHGQTSALDSALLPLLKTLTLANNFSKFDKEKITSQLNTIHKSTAMRAFVKLRWDAIRHYFNGDVDCAISSINQAHDDFKYSEEIPLWLKTNLLIDLRNIIDLFANRKDYYGAQALIDETPEILHFPILDRFEKTMAMDLADWELKQNSKSIYAVEVIGGGLPASISNNILNTFITAAIYGSLTHLLQVNILIKKALFFVCNKYQDTDCFTNYLKMCIFDFHKGDGNTLDYPLREHFSLVDEKIAKEVWDSTAYIPNGCKRLVGKLTTLRYLGYYLDSDSYNFAWQECINLIQSGNFAPYRIDSYIATAVKHNNFRLDVNMAVDIILNKLPAHPDYMSRVFLDSLFSADFSGINTTSYNLIIEFIKARKDAWTERIDSFILILRKSLSPERHSGFDNLVKEIAPELYNGLYAQYYMPSKLNLDQAIKGTLQSIREIRSHKDSLNGIEFSFGDSKVIYDLYSMLDEIDTMPSADIVREISSEVESIILSSSMDFDSKIAAIKIALLLWYKHNGCNVEKMITKILDPNCNIPTTSDLHYSDISIDVYLNLLGFILGKISPIDYMFSSYNIFGLPKTVLVSFYVLLNTATKHINFNKTSDDILKFIFQLSANGLQSDALEIRVQAIKIFVRLCAASDIFQAKAIQLISERFKQECVEVRVRILNELYSLNKDSAIAVQVMELAKRDNHYYIAKRGEEFFI